MGPAERPRTGRGVARDQVQGPPHLWTERPRLAIMGGAVEEGALVCGSSCSRSWCRGWKGWPRRPQRSALPPILGAFLARPPAGGPPCPGFLGTALLSLSFGELVGELSAAVVTCDLAFTLLFPFSFSPPTAVLPALPLPSLSFSAFPGGGGVGAAEGAGGKPVPAPPESRPSEPEPRDVEGGAKAAGNEPLPGAVWSHGHTPSAGGSR